MTIRHRTDGLIESVCDVCRGSVLVGTQDNDSDKARLEAEGWRWHPSRNPLDTCPDCLKKGH